MVVLKQSFEKLGYKNVSTYINSGNVIFDSDKQSRKLEEKIEKTLESTFGFPIRVVVKNFHEMGNIISKIPEKWNSNDGWRHNVIFLTHEIDNKDTFKDFISKPNIEEFHYFPGVLLGSAKTSDLTHSTMTTLNKSKLYKGMTVRNLNTTRKIFELMKNLLRS